MKDILKTVFLLLFVLLISTVVIAKANTIIYGTVSDEDGNALVYANVFIDGTFEGATTRIDGDYRFVTSKTGSWKLKATVIGYDDAVQTITITGGDSIEVNLICGGSYLGLDDVQVTASAYSSGDGEETVTLRSLDIVTTPGAAADVFMAVKSFPGVAMVDEGSGLFVRGGDVTETLTILDQATLVHPYRYESPTGGEFGIIAPFLLGGTFFSSGGFSAKYGNALSGVMEMNSLDMPEDRMLEFGMGLANNALGYRANFMDGKFGVRLSANYGNTETMFKVNGMSDEFSEMPHGTDGNLSLIYDYSETGRIKFFNFGKHDQFGVKVEEASYTGNYSATESNYLNNLQWREIFGKWIIRSSISLNTFDADRQMGNLDIKAQDVTTKFRTDIERSITKKLRLATGFEWMKLENSIEGTAPYYDDVFDTTARVYNFNEDYPLSYTGAYVQLETQLSRKFFLSGGLRADYHPDLEKEAIDPRFSARYQLNNKRNIRFSWGIYHQGPRPEDINEVDGNPDIGLQRSQHYVGTFEQEFERGLFRVEAYYKPYEDLILKDSNLNWNNLGDGYSRGIDVFLKRGEFIQDRIHGWLSYSYLDSERKQSRRQVNTAGEEFYLYEDGSSPFDITHNFTGVIKATVYRYMSVGLTYRYATGRPHTPILYGVKPADAIENGHDYYLPIEGQVGSERVDDYHRLDINWSWYEPLGRYNSLVIYMETSNLLDQKNVLGYDYSSDYSSRRKRFSDYKRFIYFGFMISIRDLDFGF